jgi:hypothetical protein
LKRVVAIADMHCGHRSGLTPPDYQTKITGEKYYHLQRETWNWYKAAVESLHPVDVLIVNGDAIDGRGERSGGSEIITGSPKKQCEIARDCILPWKAENIVMTRGTPYHVSSKDGIDWEDELGGMVGAAKIGDHEWISVNNVVLDCKHKIGSSTIPHGRATPIIRDVVWNWIWSEIEDQQVRGDIFLRSHVHYHIAITDPHYLAMTTPALQAAATKYGARQCSGTVHFGLVWFDIEDDGTYTWGRKIATVERQRIKPTVF